MGANIEKCGCNISKNDGIEAVSKTGSMKVAQAPKKKSRQIDRAKYMSELPDEPSKPKLVSEKFASDPPNDTEETLLLEFRAKLKAKYKNKREVLSTHFGEDEFISQEDFLAFANTELQLTDAERLFSLLDEDGDGNISKAEFKAQLDAPTSRRNSTSSTGAYTKTLNSAEKDEMKAFKDFIKSSFKNPKEAFASIDVNNDKTLDLEEFTALVREKIKYPGDIEAVFHILDIDKDGVVTWEEFKDMLTGAHKKK